MDMEKIKISKKQAELFSAYKSGKYFVYALGGGTSSGKTIAILMLFNYICTCAPGVRIGIYRKSEKTLKLNTIPSYRKALIYMGNKGDVEITNLAAKYSNGSEILFLWADISKDPDVDNVKGSEFTIVYFNEANQISRKYYDIAKTRISRWNEVEYENNKRGRVKPAIFCDFNPNQEWPKDEFYDRYMDETLPQDIYFQLSLPSDNPFRDKDSDKLLEGLPFEEKQRYKYGKWDYASDPAQLIKYEWYKACKIEQDELKVLLASDEYKSGRNVLGVDPADEGTDATAFAFMVNNLFFRYETHRHMNEIEAAHYTKEKRIEYDIADRDIIIDTIGVGAGTANTLRGDGMDVFKFCSAERPETEHEFYKYKNKRAEGGWLLRQATRDQKILFLHHPEVQKQILSIKYKASDTKELTIEPKKEIRKRLGYSCDLYDAIYMANYIRVYGDAFIANNLEDYVEIEGDMMAQYDFKY